jgi:hypothetical protein
MLCFRDMTFCSAECRTTDCRRNWTPEKAAEARQWWGDMKGEAPVAFSDFSAHCSDYDPPEEAA